MEEEIDTDELRDLPEDMESIIMKIHSKMKNLENKYIDLANFYKEGVIHRRERKHKRPPHD